MQVFSFNHHFKDNDKSLILGRGRVVFFASGPGEGQGREQAESGDLAAEGIVIPSRSQLLATPMDFGGEIQMIRDLDDALGDLYGAGIYGEDICGVDNDDHSPTKLELARANVDAHYRNPTSPLTQPLECYLAQTDKVHALLNSERHLRKYRQDLEALASGGRPTDLDSMGRATGANRILEGIREIKKIHHLLRFSDDDEALPDLSLETFKSATDTQFRSLLNDLDACIQSNLEEIATAKSREFVALKSFEQPLKAELIDVLKVKTAEELQFWNESEIKELVTEESYKQTIGFLNKLQDDISAADPAKVSANDILKTSELLRDRFTSRRENLKSDRKYVIENGINPDSVLEQINTLKNELEGGTLGRKLKEISDVSKPLLDSVKKAKGLLEERRTQGRIDDTTYQLVKKKLDESEKNLSEDICNGEKTIKKLFEKGPETIEVELPGSTLEGAKKGTVTFPANLYSQLEFANSQSPALRDIFLIGLHKNLKTLEVELSEKRLTEMKEQHLPHYKESLAELIESLSVESEGKPQSSVYWWSMMDFYRFGQIIGEWAPRRWQRGADARVSNAGANLVAPIADNLSFARTLKSEFTNLAETSEQKEINKYKEDMSTYSVKQIFDRMRAATHRDEFRACIILLTEKGRMRWDDRGFLERFNTLQQKVTLPISGTTVSTQSPSFMKLLEEATINIWGDTDLFREWESKNLSSYNSTKSGYMAEVQVISETTGIGPWLKTNLAEIRRAGGMDEFPAFDPIKYEAMLEYAIQNGKMSPADRVYYLIQGIDFGFLTMKRASELNKLCNAWPPADLFSRAGGITFAKIREWAKIDRDDNEPGTDFYHWYFTEVMHSDAVLERMQKAISANTYPDHDDFYQYAAYYDLSPIEQILRLGKGGPSEMPLTAFGNGMVGFVNYLDTLSIDYGKGSVANEKRQLTRYLTTFVNFASITDGRKYKSSGPSFFRWGTSGLRDQHPRANGGYHYRDDYGSKSTGNLIDHNFELIKTLEDGIPEEARLLSFIENDNNVGDIAKIQERVNAINDYIASKRGRPLFGENGIPLPKTYDELLTNIGHYFAYLVEENSGAVTKMLAKVKQELSNSKVTAAEQGVTARRARRSEAASMGAASPGSQG